ncbi:SDR family NAD(P)-dependent oxidoreductase [Govanella unica]|uniref:SDR family NAD(P)-dependent oxidoreductase n=1 Tax=Govanella unica TaxID=2975056 RepID=A0A9X3TVU6_9PROT|nr:SDR family NAD(P)-dependent oxidoreductase [Govania unica]MDA5192655.1 SDR family NAD(P)-dependent oxidoreductase [Govania unica]
MKLAGTAAVVTGGASGLGEATARTLAAAGVKVTLFDINETQGQQVAADIGGVFVKVDVTSAESVSAGLDAAAAAHGDARILVNCAGIAIGEKTVNKGVAHQLESFSKVITINLIGSFNCLRLAAVRMSALAPLEDGERGVVINTASVAAYEGQIGQVAYAASKGGVVGMTLPAARDMSNIGIRVCTIAPGLFLTPMMKGLPQNVQDALGANVPFPQRLGDPAEYGQLAKHICENVMLNGETIRLDGALRMAPR